MGRFIYLEKDVAEHSDSKAIQNAYEKNELTIVYFPRDNAYYFEKVPKSKKTVEKIQAELQEMYPNIKYAGEVDD